MSIWKNRETLLEDFIPPELPGREKEISEIMEFLSILPVGRPPNILVYGPRGTGKTAAVRKILNDLSRIYNPETFKMIYVPAGTPLGTLSLIASELGIVWRSRRKRIQGLPRGISITEALNIIRDEVQKYKRVIIAIDEADKLTGNPNGEEILYHFTRTIPVSLILITNKLLFLERIKDDRVVSSLRLRFIDFPRYDDEQILKILKYRASLALLDNAYDDKILETIRDITVLRSGRDIRFGLDLLLAAGDIAYAEKAERIEQRHIERALRYAEEEMARRALEKLDLEERTIIYVVAKKNIISLTRLREIVRQVTLASKVRFQNAIRELRLMEVISVNAKGRGKGKGKEFYIVWTDQWSRSLAASLIDSETKHMINQLLGEVNMRKKETLTPKEKSGYSWMIRNNVLEVDISCPKEDIENIISKNITRKDIHYIAIVKGNDILAKIPKHKFTKEWLGEQLEKFKK